MHFPLLGVVVTDASVANAGARDAQAVSEETCAETKRENRLVRQGKIAMQRVVTMILALGLAATACSDIVAVAKPAPSGHFGPTFVPRFSPRPGGINPSFHPGMPPRPPAGRRYTGGYPPVWAGPVYGDWWWWGAPEPYYWDWQWTAPAEMLGGYCATPQRTCQLIDPAPVGTGCSCRTPSGRGLYRGIVVE
jgi:hypothetical protein